MKWKRKSWPLALPGILDGGGYLVEKRVHLVVDVCHSRDGPALEDAIVCNKYKILKSTYLSSLLSPLSNRQK